MALNNGGDARPINNDMLDPELTKLSVDRVEFTRMRDAYISGLATIENAAHELQRRFIQHTDMLMKSQGSISSLDLLQLANPIGDFTQNGVRGYAPTPGPPLHVAPTRKPKRPHDKNAPKKAMTPFFLFMQTMRPQIQQEMGPDYKSKDVEAEGQHRWKTIGQKEKAVVEYQYACNRAAYFERMRHYRAGLPLPDISEKRAEELYEEQKMAGFKNKPIEEVATPEEDSVAASSSSGDTDSEESSASPPREPSPQKQASPPRTSKRRKAGRGDSTPVPVAPMQSFREPEKQLLGFNTPTLERLHKSPEKERKKKHKRSDDKDGGSGMGTPAEGFSGKSANHDAKKEKRSKKRRSEVAHGEE